MYIYIYIYTYTYLSNRLAGSRNCRHRWTRVSNINRDCPARSIRKLKLCKPRIPESTFHGRALWTWGFHPFKFKNLVQSTSLKSRFSIRGWTM